MNGFEIQLGSNQLDFLKDESTVARLLTQLFVLPSANFDKLKYEIQREFKAGGSPDITRVSFDRGHFDKDRGKGRFRVVLDINFTFGCEDVLTKKKDQTSEWSFFFEENVMVFEGLAFANERSTGDEF